MATATDLRSVILKMMVNSLIRTKTATTLLFLAIGLTAPPKTDKEIWTAGKKCAVTHAVKNSASSTPGMHNTSNGSRLSATFPLLIRLSKLRRILRLRLNKKSCPRCLAS